MCLSSSVFVTSVSVRLYVLVPLPLPLWVCVSLALCLSLTFLALEVKNQVGASGQRLLHLLEPLVPAGGP